MRIVARMSYPHTRTPHALQAASARYGRKRRYSSMAAQLNMPLRPHYSAATRTQGLQLWRAMPQRHAHATAPLMRPHAGAKKPPCGGL
jgi:hypothetical protein